VRRGPQRCVDHNGVTHQTSTGYRVSLSLPRSALAG
jgi:hypothetical protein